MGAPEGGNVAPIPRQEAVPRCEACVNVSPTANRAEAEGRQEEAALCMGARERLRAGPGGHFTVVSITPEATDPRRGRRC